MKREAGKFGRMIPTQTCIIVDPAHHIVLRKLQVCGDLCSRSAEVGGEGGMVAPLLFLEMRMGGLRFI